jgi:peptide/nickel transport system permease protein
VLAPYIAPYGEREKVGDVFEPPSSEHWLGLDDAGIDMLTLMLHGARVSLIVGFAAALVTMLIGGTIGLLAGYFGGKADVVLMRLTDYFLVIPDIPLMLVVAAAWGRSLTNIILIIGLIYWTTTARVVRAQVKSVRERVYVKRARSLGAGHARVLFRHVLPQVAPLLVAITVLSVAVAIFAETAIAFLGLGDPTLTSWGKLIENAFSRSAISVDAWWAVVPPGLAVVIVVLACTMLGRALEDSLNPRLRVGHLSVRHFRLRTAEGGEAR